MIFTKEHLKKYKQDFLNISCGEFTYGKPNLKVASSDISRNLNFGRYCSIAFGCTIFIGRQGSHPLDTLSSFPLGLLISDDLKNNKNYRRARESMDVWVGNDVWIGANVTILAGVTIGNGSVIGASSVVTKDVEPYSIMGGVPAKLIKRRFEHNYVVKLESSKWWELDPDEIYMATDGKFNESLSEEMLDCILRYREDSLQKIS